MNFLTHLCPARAFRCALALMTGIGIVTVLSVQVALLSIEDPDARQTAEAALLPFPQDEKALDALALRLAQGDDLYAIEPSSR